MHRNASSMYSCKRLNDIYSLLIMRYIVTPLRKWLETTTGLQIFTDILYISCVMYKASVGICPRTAGKVIGHCKTYYQAVLSQFISRFHRVSLPSKSIITTWTEEQTTRFLKKEIRNTMCTFRKKLTYLQTSSRKSFEVIPENRRIETTSTRSHKISWFETI